MEMESRPVFVAGQSFHRGMHAFGADEIKLKLSDVLIKPKVPELPKGAFGHLITDDPPGGWGMLGNSDAGDCVVAGSMHEHILWAWATGRPIPKFTDKLAKEQYFSQSSKHLDVGLDPVQFAWHRQKNGVIDADGIVHKIDAFVQIGSVYELELAVYLFGTAGMCWGLPEGAERDFVEGRVWSDTVMQGQSGHYTPCVGRNSKGNLVFITWGRAHAATPAYVEAYWNPGGCIAYLSREYLLATGKSPDGIDWNGLKEYLIEVKHASQP